MSREWTPAERDELAAGKITGGFAGPDQSYPIADAEDVGSAWSLAGLSKAGDADTIRAAIIRIAKKHGWTAGLPETAKDWAAERDITLSDSDAAEPEAGDEPEADVEPEDAEAPMGLACPYEDCGETLTVIAVGWFRCGACEQPVYVAAAGDEYTIYPAGNAPEDAEEQPDTLTDLPTVTTGRAELANPYNMPPQQRMGRRPTAPPQRNADTLSSAAVAAAPAPIEATAATPRAAAVPAPREANASEMTFTMDFYTPEAEPTGKAIEFLRKGEFIDAHGQKVLIDDALLDALTANFQAGAAGQDVPVDVQHQKAEAAGWITRVWREGDRLYGQATWTTLGQKLVGERIFRYLSASIDMSRKVLKAVSLVNFPAVKGLAPVELAEAMLIVTGAPLAELATPLRSEPASPRPAPPARSQAINPNPHGGTMTTPQEPKAADAAAVTHVELTAITQAVETDLLANLSAPTTTAPPAAAALLSEADLSVIRQSVETDLRQALLAEYNARRESMIADLRARWAEEHELSEFVQDVTAQGTHALPVHAAELEEFMRSLTREQRTKAMGLFRKIAEAGTVDFTEHGTSLGREIAPASRDLPDGAAYALRDFIQNGGATATFFAANPELGSAADYDLQAYGG